MAKEKEKFTSQYVKSIRPPEKGRAEYYDGASNPPGFGLRVTSKGTKTWILKYRPHGQRKVVTKTLGRYPQINLQEARQLAKVADVDREDPEQKKKYSLTFGDLASKWFEAGKDKWKDATKTNPNRKIFEARKRETAALGAGEKLVLGHPLAATIGDSARCMQNLEKVLFTGPKTSDTVTFICD